MTEQEAMEVLKQPCLCDYDLSKTVLDCDIKQCDKRDAVLQAIKALEEICQYREIKERLKAVYGECDGLLETAVDQAVENAVSILEKHEGIDIGDPYKSRLLTDEDVDKWEAYKTIGTPEECRAAMEKQKEKKIVRVKLRQSEWGSEYRCPVCESDLIKTVFFNEDGTEPDEKISWCSGCGQKLDWSDEK